MSRKHSGAIAQKAPASPDAGANFSLFHLLRPQWAALTIALVAVLGETVTGVLNPWPIKIVIDSVLHSKALHPLWLGRVVTGLFGQNKLAILEFAVALCFTVLFSFAAFGQEASEAKPSPADVQGFQQFSERDAPEAQELRFVGSDCGA